MLKGPKAAAPAGQCLAKHQHHGPILAQWLWGQRVQAVPMPPSSGPACPLPTGIKAVQGAAPVTLHHRAKGTRGPSWMSPEHQCGYGEPMLRGHCAAGGHRVGLGGHETPRSGGESEARGQPQARLCPCATHPSSREGTGSRLPCLALQHCAVPWQPPPAQGWILPCAFGEEASRQRGTLGAPRYHHLPRPIPAKI